MRELFNMVNEFAVIVASQQELIDSIEANVSSAFAIAFDLRTFIYLLIFLSFP